MELNFKGKVVFLTGAQRGIGLCIRKTFEEAGARVIAPEIAELDLTSRESIEKYASNFKEKVDIYVHCAGMNNVAPLENLDLDDTRRVFEINYFCNLRLLQAMIPSMKENKYGKIIT